MTFMNFISQSFWIPAPSLTEANLPDQSDRVFVVTGGYAGIGYELSQILYSHNGTIYLAGRSEQKARHAIEAIKSAHPNSKGRIEFLYLDLSDLTTVKKAADELMSKETRLDVLTNNAGVMRPPEGSKSTQGYELQMATNVLGPFLFTKCLMPLLRTTAASSPPGSVRVTWAASMGVEVWSPKPGGVLFDEQGTPTCHDNNNMNYGTTKAANVMLASEFANRFPFPESNIITNAWNPGNLQSELHRHTHGPLRSVSSWMLYPTILGAYTELFAGWSEDAGRQENNAKYIWPWGRFGSFREDIAVALKKASDGGTGKAAMLWDWCENETKQYA